MLDGVLCWTTQFLMNLRIKNWALGGIREVQILVFIGIHFLLSLLRKSIKIIA